MSNIYQDNLSIKQKQVLLAKLLEKKKKPALIQMTDKDGSLENKLPPIEKHTLQPGEVLPLSFSQKRLWMIDRIDGGSLPYIMSAALRIKGHLDVAILKQALQEIMMRNEVLRTQYWVSDSEEPCQHIVDSPELSFIYTDLTNDPSDRDTLIEQQRNLELGLPFDLESDIPFRARLVAFEDDDFLLVLSAHHIAVDGWSIGIINRQLSELYQSLTEKVATNAADRESLQYADYAFWQSENEQAIIDCHLPYWRDQLCSAPLMCTFPTDFKRQAIASYRGGNVNRVMNCEQFNAIRSLARKHGVSVFMVLHSLLACLLHRFTGEDTVMLGTPAANREQSEIAGMVGFFVNSLPLSLTIEQTHSFADVLSMSKRCVLDAFTHQQLPFEKLVDELKIDRSTNINPIFQVALAYNNNESQDIILADLTTSALPARTVTSKFDMTLNVEDVNVDGDKTLSINWEYATDLYTQQSVDELAEYLELLLAQVIENTDSPLNSLALLIPSHEQAYRALNDTVCDTPSDNLWQLFEQRVEQHADKLALWQQEGEVSFTYRELKTRVERFTASLVSDMQKPLPDQVVVGILSERCADAIVAMLAVVRLGWTYLPLDAKYPKERLRTILEDSGCVRVLVQNQSLCQNLPESFINKVQILGADEAEDLNSVLVPAAVVDHSQLAYIMYTSGTTGIPKGVMIRQNSIVSRVVNVEYAPLNPDDHLLLTGSLTFDASTYEIWGSLLNGCEITIVSEEVLLDTQQLAQVLSDRNITTLWMTSPLFNQHIQLNPRLFSGVRQLIVGGDALSLTHVQMARTHNPDLVVVNGYGPTENTTFSVCNRIEPGTCLEGMGAIPIGRPISNSTAYVVNSGGHLLPVGVPGELLVGGAGVADGYLNRTELTEEKFVGNEALAFLGGSNSRVYRSGDLAVLDSQGQIQFLGRQDDQVKIRGFRVEPGEIHSALRQHPQIEQSHVVVRDDKHNNKQVIAYLAMGRTLEVHESEIFKENVKEFLLQQLPDYMMPSAFVLMERLPLNKNGKVDQNYLPEPEFALRKVSERVSPENAIQGELLSIWEELLGNQSISVTDNFFSIGGDSILAIQAVAQAREKGLQLSVKSLFQQKTIRNLAKVTGSVNPLQSIAAATGEQKLLPIQNQFFASNTADIDYFNQHIMLHLDAAVSDQQLLLALQWLVEKHDVMRLSFQKKSNTWSALYVEPERDQLALKIQTHDAGGLSGIELDQLCQRIADNAQSSLNIAEGDTFRWSVIRTDTECRLVWIMHHLIVDGVSWRILVKDLDACICKQEEQLPNLTKTCTYQQWAEHLHAYAQSDEFVEERDRWLEMGCQKGATLNFIDYSITDLREQHTRSITVDFSETFTRELLQSSHTTYNTRINDLLLSALLLAMEPYCHDSTCSDSTGGVMIDLEGHGRDDLGKSIDITETVGWFTAIWPVCLHAQAGDLAKSIKHTKEQLAEVTTGGLGFGLSHGLEADTLSTYVSSSDIAFNYLGQLDRQTGSSGNIKKISLNHCGDPIGQNINRSHPLRITGMVKEERLSFIFDYHELQSDEKTIRELCDSFQSSLEAVVEHCRSAEPQKTPSDFPLASVVQEELDTYCAKYPGIEDVYPATKMQQSLLFHSLKAPNTDGVYVTQLVFTLRGADEDLMRKAWQSIADRHGIFRTVFSRIDSDCPLQIVLQQSDINWQSARLSSIGEQSLDQCVKAERARGFDVSEKPLQKFLWLEDKEVSHLIWTHHHALIDGWCLSVLLDEFLSLYSAMNTDTPAVLQDVSSYKDYIEWLSKSDQTSAKAYWKNYLQGINSATRLGVEAHSEAHSGTQLAQMLTLPDTLTDQLQNLAAGYGVTLNTIFQSAWGLLLGKYSGEKDLMFGTTVSGRPAELDGSGTMVGLFINTLPVRHQFSERSMSLADWFRSVHENMVQSNEHAYLSLAEMQQLSDIPHHQRLFESVLVFENYPFDLEQLNTGKPGQPEFVNIEGVERNDLALNLVIYPGSNIHIKLAFRSDLYDHETVSDLLSHYRNILASFCEKTTRTVADVNMLSRDETQRAIHQWNDTDADYDQDISLYDAFRQRAREQNKQTALVNGEVRLSYEELDALACRIAAALYSGGCVQGDRVVVCMPRSVELIASILAVMKLGAVYVPVALDCPKERWDFILNDAQIRSALIHSEHDVHLSAASIPTVMVNELPQCNSNDRDIETERRVRGCDEAYVIYTSGTTGTPKGVSVAHRSLMNLCQHFSDEGWLEAGKSILQFAPYTFDASIAEIFIGLLCSATIHIVEEPVINDPVAMQEYLNQHDVRLAAFPPQYVQHLSPTSTHKNLRLLTAGSAPTLSLINDWGKNHDYVNAYGPTETTVLSSAWKYCREDLQAGKISIGKPLANTQIYVVDQFDQLCAPGQKGEIRIGGDGVALGYLNREDLNKKHFTRNPWKAGTRLYHTGDLGRWLPSGDIEFLGRCDHQVKVRGYRIEPDEVERCCLQESLVDHCLVMARPDAFGDLMLVAYVGSTVDKDALVPRLKKQITTNLPPYMMPSHFLVLPELPITANGKLDRKALSRLKIESASSDRSLGADVTEQEEQLLQIWRQYLSNDSLQVNDDFFDFGGNSILLLRMMKPMQTAGFDIPVNELYQRRTVRKCCELFALSANSLVANWKDRDIQSEFVIHLEQGVRTDFWLLQQEQEFSSNDLQQFFANVDGAALPDHIRFVPDLHKAKCEYSAMGKQALSGWNRPYFRTIKTDLQEQIDRFQRAYLAAETSSTIEFTPLQRSMMEWEERSVFELLSIYGWYCPDALKQAFNELVADQELMRSISDEDSCWEVIDAKDFNAEIPCLDIRFLDDHSQNKLILGLAHDLQAWQKKSSLPYVACWVSVSDTKHYFLMLNDHLISDESTSLAIKSNLNQTLQGKRKQPGRHYSDYANHLRNNLTQDNAEFVKNRIDVSGIVEAKRSTEDVLHKRRKLPIRRVLIRVPLEKKKSALDQSFAIFIRIAAQILDLKEFCMVMNHFGRQIEGQNDFHQVGLFLDKIPFVVNERTQLEDINTVVDELGEKGISFVGLSEGSLLGEQECLPRISNEVLFNYQGDQQKDPMVQQWFSQLDLKKSMKKFNGIVFEARQLDRELSIHCIFRGKKSDPDVLLNLIEGARFSGRMLDNKYYNVTYWQRIKSFSRDPLYRQLQSPNDSSIAIEVKDAKKSYGDFQAVKGVNFSIEKGKCFGVLGPNGAGKTTLLSMMEGILNLDSGSINILGMDVSSDLKNIQPHIGVQLQQNNYFQFLNVEELLLFYRDLRTAVSGRSIGQSIDELLDKLSLSDKRKSLVEELSGGQQQRLSIAIAMLNEPDIVFLDEPTSALDPQTRRYIWDYIEQLKESGDKTIIITTHYMEEAERLCDEIIIMNEGQITAQGSPEKLIDDLNAYYDITLLLGKGEVDEKALHSLSGVTHVHWGVNRKELTISTSESAKTLKELFEYIEESSLELLQFHVDRPSLEDVFISNTGKELRE